MPTQLTLPPEASAASTARRWVRSQLVDLGRSELLDSAELGVSELVTNAFLHVRGPISVRVDDVVDPLRIEVYDDCGSPPQEPRPFPANRQAIPSTVGRGLTIVESVSHAWGVEYEHSGKYVWFQPIPGGAPAHGVVGGEPARMPSPEPPQTAETNEAAGGAIVHVWLMDVPIRLLIHYRTRIDDLRRELTLIAVDEDSVDTLPRRLNRVAHELERYRGWGTEATRRVDEAAADGLDRVTLELDVPRDAVEGIERLGQLLAEANAFCEARQLLTLAAGLQEQALREWYLGEFVAQGRGARPTPWQGQFVVTDASVAP